MKFDRRDFLKILPVAPTIISAAETKSYRGMSDSAGWRADAHKRIEQHRKDDFKVRIIESAEKPVKNLKVDISLYRHHFGFGAAPKLARFYDQRFSAEVRGLYHDFCEVLFHKLTPENSLKWKHYKNNKKFVEPFLSWCKQKKIPVRGHCLVWPEFRRAPKSIEKLRGDPKALGLAIREHIKFMINNFDYPVTEWDVLNEAVNHDQYMRILGKEVVTAWFQLVKNLNPSIKNILMITVFSLKIMLGIVKDIIGTSEIYWTPGYLSMESVFSPIFQKDLTQPHQRKLFVLRMTFLVLVLNFKSLSLILKLQIKIFRQGTRRIFLQQFSVTKK